MPDSAEALWWAAEGPADAPALVLVPDAHRPASVWPPALRAALVGAGWRVVRLDLADQGRSPRRPPPFGLADLAAGVSFVLRAVGPAQVVGHGLGASVALELALGPAPDLVAGLVLVGATGWFVDPALAGPDEPAAVGLVWRSRLGEGEDVVAALAREERLLAGPDDPGPAAAVAEVRRWLAHGFNPADDHRAAWLAAPSRWEALAAAASGAARRLAPLTVVHGAADPWVPLAHGRRLAATVPGSTLVEVAGAGHGLTPRLVAGLLEAIGPAPMRR